MDPSLMMLPLAQGSPNTLVAAVLFTAVSLPIGILIGYLWAYRFKRQYVRVARELANLRGENFRGELTTVGVQRRPGPVASGGPSPLAPGGGERALHEALTAAQHERDELANELSVLRQRADELQHALDAARVAAEPTDEPTDEPEPSRSSDLGTEAWQLAQLHREQITMQLKLDDYVAQVAELTEDRDLWHRQAEAGAQDVERLRELLGQQEAVIASLERERDSLAARISELEHRSERY